MATLTVMAMNRRIRSVQRFWLQHRSCNSWRDVSFVTAAAQFERHTKAYSCQQSLWQASLASVTPANTIASLATTHRSTPPTMEGRLCTDEVIDLLDAEDMDMEDVDEEPMCEESDDSLGLEMSDDER